jgi:serine/threonine protein kinase
MYGSLQTPGTWRCLEHRIRMFTSVQVGLEHLHRNGIAFRALSTETVLICENGYAQLADMRFVKVLSDRTFTMCGHPAYMAPEMVLSTGHTEAVDWWSLGVFIFRMVAQHTPFAAEGVYLLPLSAQLPPCMFAVLAQAPATAPSVRAFAPGSLCTLNTTTHGRQPRVHPLALLTAIGPAADTQMMIFTKITSSPVMYPKNFSPALCSLLEGLLNKDPTARLPYATFGISALKDHPWFAPIDWGNLLHHAVTPPHAIREAMYDLERLPVLPLAAVPLSQPPAWLSQF